MDIILFSASVLVPLVSSRRSSEDATLRKALQESRTLDALERVCIVTPDNRPLPNGALRSQMRLQNLWHRATYILVVHRAPHLPPHHAKDRLRYDTSLDDEYVLVQKRSLRKDYCPGKFDPTPGGVVGYRESYQENAEREIAEEMGIHIGQNDNSLQQLFKFSYQDDRVRVWGDFYECVYHGTLNDLVLQDEEVEEVTRMSLQELKTRLDSSPEDFMPDSAYAMQLYFQRRTDIRVERRLLPGYSSSNLDEYELRSKPKVIFFDCDDCLYFDNWVTARKLTAKIDEWCVNHGLKSGQAYQLYKQYGTALRGLLAEGYLEDSEEAIDRFLQDVHDIGVSDMIQKDNELREMILSMDPSIPRYVFTASVRDHAERCLAALGIDNLFVDIIDCKACDLETKHAPHSFRVAMSVADVDTPEACLFFDDNLRNIEAARHVGWRSVLVGRRGRDSGLPVSSEHAELEIDRIHHVRSVLPELFQ